jgi:rubrerythrin
VSIRSDGKSALDVLDMHFGESPTRALFREQMDELAALFEGMCEDDRARLAAMRRAALYLEQRGRSTKNTRLFAEKQDPKHSGSGVCTKCGAPVQSRNVDGECPKCTP